MTVKLYAYRILPGGYCDSICLDCFRTVASEYSMADLTRKEQDHVCLLLDLKNRIPWRINDQDRQRLAGRAIEVADISRHNHRF